MFLSCPGARCYGRLAGVNAPKKRGRPPKDASNPTGRGSYHLGLRLSDERRDALLKLVDAANERARGAGIPATVTASSLVQLWIGERIDAETAKLAKRR
jgi:hypothetical protein